MECFSCPRATPEGFVRWSTLCWKDGYGIQTEAWGLHSYKALLWQQHPRGAKQQADEELLGATASDIEAPTAPSSRCARQGNAVEIEICDVAGSDGEQLQWQGLQRGCDCVCFSLDSASRPAALEEARRELLELFFDEHFVLHRDIPFLVLATKQDLCNAREPQDIEEFLALPEEVEQNALSGLGVSEVEQWLAAVATAAAKPNSRYWTSHVPPQRLRCDSRGSASAYDANSLSGRRDEMLGPFAVTTPPARTTTHCTSHIGAEAPTNPSVEGLASGPPPWPPSTDSRQTSAGGDPVVAASFSALLDGFSPPSEKPAGALQHQNSFEGIPLDLLAAQTLQPLPSVSGSSPLLEGL
ncbi:ADP-ribosylation factor family protein [Cyclospora cayetanensis]|uniref:ADP-ribosylation factor family protein n=1 Tax=Cyclospora cayetanensis TaxID=88456 RepID=A0A1D3CXX9_9EIME|nr:ADP-ribosylation factor family protein [Cyclospora cayetanensis]